MLFCSGCHSRDSELTQMQMREIQTQTFAACNAKIVLKEMINVLQDNAFIVKNANAELGFLSGEKDVNVENGWLKALVIVTGGRSWKKNAVIEISANVTQFGKDARVRINVQRKQYDNFGRVMRVKQILDPNYYQQFFEKVHKALFIHQEQI